MIKKKRIQHIIYGFSLALLLSGITAFPIQFELETLQGIINTESVIGDWVNTVYNAYVNINHNYPFFAYGTDWLAFAHIILAILFWGAAKDLVRNKWVFSFGIISCIGIIPLALIAGSIRQIPFFWQCIDLSFGIFGLIPLIIILRYIKTQESKNLVNN